MTKIPALTISDSDQQWKKSPYWLFLIFCILICSCGIYVTRHYYMDDALITLRYSYNFARFGIPIWNQADIKDPSMGYTSILWMGINTLPALFTNNKDILVPAEPVYGFQLVYKLLCTFRSGFMSVQYHNITKFAVERASS